MTDGDETTNINVIYQAWAKAERATASLLNATGAWKRLAEQVPPRRDLDAARYQSLHDSNRLYQTNNWLIGYASQLAKCNPETVLELGTGNGNFARAVSKEVDRVIAIDWARSPAMIDLPANVTFLQRDILHGSLPEAGLVCSADVLEHVAPQDLPALINNCLSSSANQFHVIACYDDGHSHLTVMPPSSWLALFREFAPEASVGLLQCRRNNPLQVVCAVACGTAASLLEAAFPIPKAST